ncbi:DUF4388 domain-containing protein [candidate division CSSED10-310 bacterium]|uniref:DUF4388 domain-containing protein n=1 Tax=candidate division CSSED10-310 bacterium TaxID=2855610 RepID=A0ABV6Z0M8_UNCC1
MTDDKEMKGRLDDLTLADILKVLVIQKKTGTLLLVSSSGEGMVVVKEGKIVYAISPNVRMNLVDLLLNHHIITEQDLEKALAIQRESDYQKRLSAIFMQLGLLDEKQLATYISWQIENAVLDLLKWNKGEFQFQIGSLVIDQNVAIDPENLTLDFGYSPQYLMWEASQTIDSSDYEFRAETPVTAGQVGSIKTPDMRPAEASIPGSDSSASDAPEPGQPEQPPPAAIVHTEPEPESVDSLFRNLTKRVQAEGEETIDTDLGLVMVVDDETYFRKLFSDCLESKGYLVISCAGVQEALQEIRKYKGQIKGSIIAAIVDVIMPETAGDGILGGFELLNHITIQDPDLQVLMISASHDPELHYKAFELGARNYLSKPTLTNGSFKDRGKNIEHFVDELAFCLHGIFHERKKSPSVGHSKFEPEEPASKLDSVMKSPISLDDLTKLQQQVAAQESVEDSLYFLLKVAYDHFDRGVLYLVRKNDIISLTGFDKASPEHDQSRLYTKFRFPLEELTVYKKVIDNPYPYIGFLKEEDPLEMLETEMKGFFDGEHYIAPLVCEGETYAILHLNNSLTLNPLKNIEKFEIILIHISLSIQKSLLHLKIKKQKK